MAVEPESSKLTNMHDNTMSLLSAIKLLEENCASCISEQEFVEIFEPTYKLLPGISRTKIYTFFNERMRKANISKAMNMEDLNQTFAKKASLIENCKPFENTVAWRPSGNVKSDLTVLYNEEIKSTQEKLENDIHTAKSELKTLIDEILYKKNKIDRRKNEVPELISYVDQIQQQQEEIKKMLGNNNSV